MDPEIKKYIDEEIKRVTAFQYKKYGDTPTDALQLVPKKYVTSVLTGIAVVAGATTQIQFNRGGAFAGSPALTYGPVASILNGIYVSSVFTVGAPDFPASGNAIDIFDDADFGYIQSRNPSGLKIQTNDNTAGVQPGNITVGPGTASGGGNAAIVTVVGGDDGANGGGTATIKGGAGTVSALKGVVQIGYAGLATTTTGGFVHMPECAGTPTGASGNVVEGAMIFDTTAGKLWVYHSGWKSVTFS